MRRGSTIWSRLWSAGVAGVLGCALLLMPPAAEAQRGKGKSASRKAATSQAAKKKSGKSASKKSASARKSTASKSAKSKKRASKSTASKSSAKKRSTKTAAASKSRATKRAASRPAKRSTARATQRPASRPLDGGSGLTVSQRRDLARETMNGSDRSAVRTKGRPVMRTPVTVEQLPPAGANDNELRRTGLDLAPRMERPSLAPQPLYVEGNIGLYTTAGLRLNYVGSSWPYDYSARAKYTTTQGFVDNAARQEIGVGAKGGYIIGDNYGIFSGGHMGAEVGYQSETYHLYAVPSAPERKKSLLELEANGKNSYRGLSYELRGGYTTLGLAQDSTSDESSIDGMASVTSGWMGLTVGGGADIRLTNLAGSSIPYTKLNAFAAYSNSFLKIMGGGALDLGSNNDGTSDTKFSPVAELQLYPVRGLTAIASLEGGINPVTLRRMLAQNPYVELRPTVRQEIERISYKGELRIEPWTSFGLRLMGRQTSYDRYLYFSSQTAGAFAPHYDEATVTTAVGDLYWQVDWYNLIGAMVTYNQGELGATKGAIPYLPTWDVEAMYGRRFVGTPLSLTATLHYIGERSDSDGVAVMEAVPLLSLQGRYSLSSHFDLTLELSNLLDRDYQLWRGYAERGIYGAIGIGMKY